MYKTILLLSLFALVFSAAGCNEKEKRENAQVLARTPLLVSQDEATGAEIEPVTTGKMAMPCLQFKHSQGFLDWLEAYRTGEDEQALKMADSVKLPRVPEADLVQALKMSQAQGALQTSVCGIQNNLGVFSWAVEFPEYTEVYTYRQPNHEKITVGMPARTPTDMMIASSTDLTKTALPLCLPKQITNSELIWFCGTPYETWKEVHVNRRLGNMVQLLCKPDENGQPELGCLDPTAKQ